jgi:hypothetical protein
MALMTLMVLAGAGGIRGEAIAEENVPKGVCEAVSVSTAAGQATTVQLHCLTLPGARLVYEILSGPRHGTVSLNSATGQATYTPAPGYSGPDSFSYSAEHLGTALATVSIGVGQAPASTGFVLAGVSQSHSVWREGNRPARSSRARAPVGTSFSFTLSQAASVTFAFTQQLAGRKSRGRCVPRAGRRDRRPPCTRTLTRGELALTAHSGRNKVAFQGVLSAGRKLPRGRYTLRITAQSAARQKASARPLQFAIVR